MGLGLGVFSRVTPSSCAQGKVQHHVSESYNQLSLKHTSFPGPVPPKEEGHGRRSRHPTGPGAAFLRDA